MFIREREKSSKRAGIYAMLGEGEYMLAMIPKQPISVKKIPTK